MLRDLSCVQLQEIAFWVVPGWIECIDYTDSKEALVQNLSCIPARASLPTGAGTPVEFVFTAGSPSAISCELHFNP